MSTVSIAIHVTEPCTSSSTSGSASRLAHVSGEYPRFTRHTLSISKFYRPGQRGRGREGRRESQASYKLMIFVLIQ